MKTMMMVMTKKLAVKMRKVEVFVNKITTIIRDKYYDTARRSCAYQRLTICSPR